MRYFGRGWRYRQSANEMARLPILDVPRRGLLPNRAAIHPRPAWSQLPPSSRSLVRSCLREDESELSYHPEFLPFYRSARRASWHADISVKNMCVLRAIYILFHISNSHALLFYCMQILFYSWKLNFSFSFSLLLSLRYRYIDRTEDFDFNSSKSANNDETMTYPMIVQSHIPTMPAAKICLDGFRYFPSLGYRL